MKKELNVKVKFFSKENGGREELPEDLLSIGTYRPHFVIGDPGQKIAVVNEDNEGLEDYLGVVFISQEGALKKEEEIEAVVTMPYPEIDYSNLINGVTFTIREGGKIIGNGKVI